MSKAQLARRALAEVSAKHGTFVDPFSSERLDILEHSQKLVLTTVEERLYNQNESRQIYEARRAARRARKFTKKTSLDDAEDALAPVFFEAAMRIFPSDLDVRSNRRIVILGGPSSGKTMLIKHLAVLCATKQDVVRGAESQAFVPLVLSLTDVTAFIETEHLSPDDDILGSFFEAKYAAETKRAQFVRDLIKRCRAWILLDALDEAVSDASIAVFVKYLDHLTTNAPKLRILVTARFGDREAAHRTSFYEMGFTILRMRPLTTELAELMLTHRLCGTPGSVLFTRKDQLPDWLHAEIQRPRYKTFRKNPLALSLLISVLHEVDEDFGAHQKLATPTLASLACERKESASVSGDQVGDDVNEEEEEEEEEEAVKDLDDGLSISKRKDGEGSRRSKFTWSGEPMAMWAGEPRVILAMQPNGAQVPVPLGPEANEDSSYHRETWDPVSRSIERDVHNKTLEAHYKQPCPGVSLTAPYSRIDLFRRAIVKLLLWEPIERKTKTSCRSPAHRHFGCRSPGAAKTVHVYPRRNMHGLAIEFPSHMLKSFDEVDPVLLELLQAVAYSTHERETRSIRLRDFDVAAQRCSDAIGAEFAMRDLMARIESQRAPIFTIEDHEDFVEENTLEQRQHQRDLSRPPRSRVRYRYRSPTFEPGKLAFLHLSLQEHLAAEYIANALLDIVADHKMTTDHDEGHVEDAKMMEEEEEEERDAHAKPSTGLRPPPVVTDTASGAAGGAGAGSSPEPGRWSRRRSRSVVSPDLGRRRFGRHGPKARRASVPDARKADGGLLDLTKLPELRARVESCVEHLLIGHFDPDMYRVSQTWWQPVIMLVFDLLAEQAPPSVPECGLFDIALEMVVLSCRRLQRYEDGRMPAALESFWLAAAEHGNVLVAQGLIRIVGIDLLLQTSNIDNNNALHIAATSNQPDIIKMLMAEAMVDVEYLDQNNRQGWDPSNMAMIFNHTYCFRLLCWTDGDKVAASCQEWQRPAIVDAAMKGNLEEVLRLFREDDEEKAAKKRLAMQQRSYLQSAGASSLELSPGCNENAAHVANTGDSQKATIQKDINSLAGDGDEATNRNKRQPHPTNASPVAARNGARNSSSNISSRAQGLSRIQLRRLKLEERRRKNATKSLISIRGSSGMTALMWAARNGHVEIVDELIRRGANLEDRTQDDSIFRDRGKGITALIFAVESGNYACVERLLAAGANPMDRTSDEDSTLLCACSFGFDDVAKLLIGSGASALEALVVSCVQGKNSTVRSLVSSGVVDVNMVWQELMVTPLAGACVAGHLSTVRLLLALGADPDMTIDVEYGSTPLMLASHMGNIEVAQSLLDAGANVNARVPPSSQCAAVSGRNATAVSIAHESGHMHVERLLRAHGGRVYVPLDLEFYEWLGGHVRYPDICPNFAHRLRSGVSFETLLSEDPYLQRVDLGAWQWLGGRTQGEAAWTPGPRSGSL